MTLGIEISINVGRTPILTAVIMVDLEVEVATEEDEDQGNVEVAAVTPNHSSR